MILTRKEHTCPYCEQVDRFIVDPKRSLKEAHCPNCDIGEIELEEPEIVSVEGEEVRCPECSKVLYRFELKKKILCEYCGNKTKFEDLDFREVGYD